MENNQLHEVDITVVGGGMVGAAVALGFAQRDFSVALVEVYQPKLEFKPETISNRVSAITRASENLLKQLDVWTDILAMRSCAYEQMHVWDATGEGSIHFDAAELGEASLGYIIENNVISQALWQKLEQQDNVELVCPDKVTGVSRNKNVSKVQLESGKVIHSGLVVAADGKQSPVRDMLEIKTRGWLYDQHALVATVTTENGHRETAWQRFMPDGPLAFLPLNTDADKTCSIVWSTTPEKAERYRDMSEQEFLQAITQASEARLGRVLAVESRAVFPLELKHSDDYVREGFVLIGDAAHAIHPLAGQGVNLGFLDVVALLDIVANAKSQQRQIGSMHVLRQYERRRKGSNMTMLASMDIFKRLFGNRFKPLAMLRNRGLTLVDNLGPVKTFFTRYAMSLD